MILDFVPDTGAFCLYVDPAKANPQKLMRTHGLDYSKPASTGGRAVLYTKNPYAATAFANCATIGASLQLSPQLDEIAASWKDSSDAHIKCPPDQELWPFQRAAVEYALRRRHTLIGDQPGLGKTPTAICLSNELGARRVLVVCPANIRRQWARMVRIWSTMPGRPLIYPIVHSRNGVHPTAEWTIVSYDLARSPAIFETLLKGRYDLLILDEAHYLKSPSARRTRSIFAEGVECLSEVSERVVALTGTPLPNRPKECYTLTRGLCFEAIDGMSEAKFLHRFNPAMRGETEDGTVFTDERTGRLPELQSRLRSHFMVRRLKKDVLSQLPQIRHQITHIDPDGAIRKALEAESMLAIDPTHLEGKDAEVLGHISVVRKMMGMAIAPHAASYVDMLLDGGEEKIFLVGWHIDVLNILEAHLEKWGVLRVDGSTSMAARERNVAEFQSNPRKRIFLGNILAIGIGVDGLQNVASHMVAAEPDWTPGNNQQVVDRLHRIGQNNAVLAEWLVAPGSFAERILATSIDKLHDIDVSLDKQGW